MPRPTTDPQQALRNAAALMLLLGQEEAQSVMSQLAAQEAEQLRTAISRIDPHHSLFANSSDGPASTQVDINLDQPDAGSPASGFGPSRLLSDSSQYVRSMLSEAFGDAAFSAAGAGKTRQPRSGDGLARLKRTDVATVAHYLAGEHPQISAVVLAWLEHDLAARILQLLPPRLRNELMLRIAHLGVVQSAALQDLQEALADILTLHEARKDGPHGGIATAVQLLTRLGAHLEGPMMEAIRARDPAMAQRISERLSAPKSGLAATAKA